MTSVFRGNSKYNLGQVQTAKFSGIPSIFFFPKENSNRNTYTNISVLFYPPLHSDTEESGSKSLRLSSAIQNCDLKTLTRIRK